MHSSYKLKNFTKYYIRNTKVTIFYKENQIFGFPCFSTREELSIDVSITNVGLILMKLG